MIDDNYKQFAEIMTEVAKMRMPFGKFGPTNFPPSGIPIYDLSYEYLAYFQRKGFPNGKLGQVMKFVYHAKLDGADAMFDPIRKLNGGRISLRKQPKKKWDF